MKKKLMNIAGMIAAVALMIVAVETFAPKPVQAQAKYFDTVTNIKQGQTTLVAGVAVVADTSVTANTRIFPVRHTVAGTSGVGMQVTRTAGTSFTITSQTAGALTTQTADTSTVDYLMVEP